jgi:photosystem II stability/assembly factor-like uncharacterized protein
VSGPSREGPVETNNPCPVHSLLPPAMLHTTDGGHTWVERGHNPDSGLGYLSFLDPMHGWSLDSGPCTTQCQEQQAGVARTVDGGASWQLVAETPPRAADPNGVDHLLGHLSLGCGKGPLRFVDPRTGFMGQHCSSNALHLLVTHDAGSTWWPIALEADSAAESSEAPQFPTPRVGFVKGSNPGAGGEFTTRDGGATWQRLTMPGTTTSAPAFVTETLGYAAGAGAFMWRTTTGGRTWASYPSNVDLSSKRRATVELQFISAVIGFAVTTDSTDSTGRSLLWRTHDGGATWTELPTTLSAG